MNFYRIKKESDDSFSCEGKILTSEKITLVDPTYDLTFKSLFFQYDTQDESWKKRTISLLNSLIYEDQITDIERLDKEYVEPPYTGNKNGEKLRLLRTDLSFKLEINNKEDCDLINLINIEMLLDYPSNFLERLVNNGMLLKKNYDPKKYNFKTIILGFLNFKGNNIWKSKSYGLSKFSSENNKFIKKIDDFMDIIIINLYEIEKKLENDEKIYILGKEIGTMGKNWLKLLSLRHWGKKLENICYEIPDFNINQEMYSAINYLKTLSKEALIQYYEEEKEYYDSINKAAEVLAEEKAEKLAEKLAEEKAEKLAEKLAEEKAKEKATDEKLRIVLSIYKTVKDLNLENLEKNEIINFSELDINKVESFWGKEDKDETKLEELKKYINKKRKKYDNANK